MFNTGHLAATSGSRTRSQGNEVRALGWANTKADRNSLVPIRAHRRGPRPQHSEQARLQLTRPDRLLDWLVEPIAEPADEPVADCGWSPCCSLVHPFCQLGCEIRYITDRNRRGVPPSAERSPASTPESHG